MRDRSDDLDLLVLGAGPAGLSAAVVARALGLRARVLEARDRPGGQLLRNPTPILDWPGVSAPSGPAAAAALEDHLGRLGGCVDEGRSVTRVDAAAGEVLLAGPAGAAERLRARFLVLATGARPRLLGVPGEADAPGRGPWPAARQHADRYRGGAVVVVGGGDVALEEARLFAAAGARVALVHRGRRFRARPDFRAAVVGEPLIDVRMETALVAIEGAPDVSAARLRGPRGIEVVPADAVFLCIGLTPNSELVAGQVDRDAAGFVCSDARQRTSSPRLYAAGDVCAHSAWSVAAAVGQAAIAVKDIERRLAAGDGP